MNKDEAIQVIRKNFPTGRHQLCKALETLIPELKESDDGKPCGGIVLEDFNGGEGFYKVNLAYLNKEQVIEIEELVKKWNPKLKESEDERIRKTLKSFFDSEISDYGNVEWRNGIRYGEIVSWLEKQGEHNHCNREVNDEALQQQLQIWFDKGKCSGRDEVIFHPENFGLQKQGEQNNKHLYDVIIALWDLLDKIDTFSDLQIDDTNLNNPFKKIEYIAQERHKFVKSDGYNLYIQGKQITDFKQSKQKPADKCIGCNNFKGCITCIDGNQYAHITEQKPTDEIKPRFKVGDWVRAISSGNIFKILSVNDGLYRVLCYDGVEANYPIIDVEKDLAYWTIQDAKDGDVLLFEGYYNSIVLFQGIGINGKGRINYHCKCDLGNYSFGVQGDMACLGTIEKDSEHYHPATKEQRDLLFSKMKESGYDWDSEKKKLKKIVQKPKIYDSMDDLIADALIEEIENSDLDDRGKHNRIVWIKSHRQKPTWSEEECQIIKDASCFILSSVNTAETKEEEERLDKLANKLQNLRPQPKQEWSEDEKIRKEIISVVEQYVKICERESAPCDEEDITNWIAWLEKQGLQKQRKEWDADDLLNYNQIMHILQDCNQTELMDWLEKQSDKKSAEWSEEDKRMIDTIIYDLERHGGKEDSCYSAEINWLKSLKERMKG